MKSTLQEYLSGLAAGVAVTLLLATAVGLCLAALYMYVIGMLAAPFAALVTAGGAFVLAGLVIFGVWLACKWGCASSRSTQKPRAPGKAGDALDSALIGLAVDWIKANAKKATFTGLIAGVAAGASPDLRRLLIRMLQKSQNSG